MTRLGQLREQITIEQRAEATGARGPIGTTWSTLATVYANVEPTSAREAIRLGQQEPQTDYVVTIHYRSDITAAMRVSWGSRTLQIVAPPINPDQKKMFTELRCREAAD